MTNGSSLVYVLLSPTFGMHQYTADLAARGAEWGADEVHLVTTDRAPLDRYGPQVTVHTPVSTHSTGFARDGLDPAGYRRVLRTIIDSAAPHERLDDRLRHLPTLELTNLPTQPAGCAIVHLTGVHAWNVFLVPALRRRSIPVVHTLHDPDPHLGVRHAAMIRLWNRRIVGGSDRILVHGRCYRDALIAGGVPAARVVYAPLLHGFCAATPDAHARRSTTCDPQTILFFGRIEAYKGVDMLLAAWPGVREMHPNARLILAGKVSRDVTLPSLPEGVELRDRAIGDEEALALFRDAGLLVLPYRDATQSAMIAAAYALGVPVVVTRTGALPEYVDQDITGWVVPPDDPAALSAALRDALSSPERLDRMSVATRAWYDSHRREESCILRELYADLAIRRAAAGYTGAQR